VPAYSGRAKKKCWRAFVFVEVETSHRDWEHRSSLIDDLPVVA
jgi:hypothetical protein